MRRALPGDALRHWFAGLVQNVMYGEVGLCDPPVVDYLTDLVTEFIHSDRIFGLRDAYGRPLDQVADMLALTVSDVSMSRTARDRLVHRHIGDFVLFWTGIFPENLRRLCAASRRDHLIDYLAQGKRSYAIASELSGEDVRPPASLLRRLSDEFEDCVFGLGRVRDEVRAAAGFDSPPGR